VVEKKEDHSLVAESRGFQMMQVKVGGEIRSVSGDSRRSDQQ
jgi:hypothetical protein